MTATLTEIESSIQTLPVGDFLDLAAWMADRHLKVLATQEFESLELEEALLRSLDSLRQPVNDELLDAVRARGRGLQS